MAKKIMVFTALLAVCGAALFAQETAAFGVSAGVGGFIGGDFGGGYEGKASYGGQSMSVKIEVPYFGGGAYAFLDATYAELTLGIYSGGGKVKQTTKFPGISDSSVEQDSSIVNFNIALLGKYPFAISDTLSLFPLLGIEYDIGLAAKQDDKDYKGFDGKDEGGPGDFSALWFKLGGGLDFSLTENIYLRFEALYGLRLANKMEADLKDLYDKQIKGIGADADYAKALLGHGLTVKLAVGYKF